ncbi:hypothetical protein, variant 1 [Aphanomyces invadans]|uniref:Uncharacterized protein n=2 Tax=Aphanomyces invadans TaxID=157072 RepID=A0A024TN08_9STRA|nr:hypothetical protein, variant 1 [Aphanomyces invadans]ETV95374.1 hypothetical protein, variant 1 [Aphanomyces invadans]|eukprot:XP_008876075.1 hypothetical protein, variant 1 [Aphanomyces invadans]
MLRHKRRRLMSASGESTSRRVDSGEEPLDTFHEHANTDEIMDDTLAAIHVLLSRYHAEFAAMNLPSLVLWHQLYSLVENRTAVDQSVQRMRNSGLIMTLRISLPGPHAMAILLTSDYIAFMLQYTKQHRATRVFAKALPQLTKSPILTASGFVDAVESLFRSRQRTPPSSSVLEQDLTHLVQSRFLVASTNLEAKQFYFTLPRLGMVITGIARARKALTNLLKRQPYHELVEVDVRKKKLTCSRLGMDFHILDMAGAALFIRIPTAQSFILKLDDSTDISTRS